MIKTEHKDTKKEASFTTDFNSLPFHIRGFPFRHLCEGKEARNKKWIPFKLEIERLIDLIISSHGYANLESMFEFAVQTIYLNNFFYDFDLPPIPEHLQGSIFDKPTITPTLI